MSGRTTRFRTVLLVALCVVSLLAAPTTAVATPENPFGGDSTDGTTAGDHIGDTLDGSGDTTSSNDTHHGDSAADSDADSTSGGSDDGTATDSDADSGSTSDDSGSTTLSGSDDGDSSADTDSGDESGSTTDSSDDEQASASDGEASSDEESLLSPLATSVNTTVASTTDTVESTTDADPSDWSALDDRTDDTGDAAGPTSVDWATFDDTVVSTLSGTDEDPSLEVEWDEASLSESTGRTTSSTGTLSGSLSGTTAVVTDRVLNGLTAVVDVESVDGPTTGDAPGPDVAVTASTAPAGVEPSGSGPADTSGSGPERSALVPADSLTDTGASLGTAGGTGTPLPADSSPTTGFAVGVGGVAALAAVRQGLFATAGTGVAGTASAMAASVTPALTGRSSALDRLVRMLTAFRYSRYDDSDPLEHEARADVFDVVEETPGAYLSEVAERADLPLSTARHHVRVLEREELLMGAKVRGKRRFYPAYSGDIELAAALNDDSTAVVLDALARLGGSSVSELADELGRDPSTVTHHLQRLEEDGLVVREREGRAVINRLAAAARTALEPETEAAVSAEASGAMASD